MLRPLPLGTSGPFLLKRSSLAARGSACVFAVELLEPTLPATLSLGMMSFSGATLINDTKIRGISITVPLLLGWDHSAVFYSILGAFWWGYALNSSWLNNAPLILCPFFYVSPPHSCCTSLHVQITTTKNNYRPLNHVSGFCGNSSNRENSFGIIAKEDTWFPSPQVGN